MLIIISINNYYPSISLHIDNLEDEEKCMHTLVDTGTAMNIGNLLCHLYVMFQCSVIVKEYLRYGKNTDYDIIQLLVVLDLNVIYYPVGYGEMTTKIEYKTPYYINK